MDECVFLPFVFYKYISRVVRLERAALYRGAPKLHGHPIDTDHPNRLRSVPHCGENIFIP